MKNIFKFVLVILTVCFTVFLNSCGECGGTIIVKNNYSEDKIVTVYSKFSVYGIMFSYEDKYGPKNITAGSTASFSVDSNTKYGIVWNHNTVDEYTTVEVSNGETVEVNIPAPYKF